MDTFSCCNVGGREAVRANLACKHVSSSAVAVSQDFSHAPPSFALRRLHTCSRHVIWMRVASGLQSVLRWCSCREGACCLLSIQYYLEGLHTSHLEGSATTRLLTVFSSVVHIWMTQSGIAIYTSIVPLLHWLTLMRRYIDENSTYQWIIV